MRTCLYILCGLPYAGKSTLARALTRRFGWEHIAIDAINGERGLGLDGQAIAAADWDITYGEAFRRLRAALAREATVVFDAPSFTREQRDELRAMAGECGAMARVLYVATPEAVARARWLGNRRTRERSDVRDEDFANVLAQFVAPEADEDALVFDGQSAAEDWIDAHFAGRG